MHLYSIKLNSGETIWSQIQILTNGSLFLINPVRIEYFPVSFDEELEDGEVITGTGIDYHLIDFLPGGSTNMFELSPTAIMIYAPLDNVSRLEYLDYLRSVQEISEMVVYGESQEVEEPSKPLPKKPKPRDEFDRMKENYPFDPESRA